MHAAGDFDGEGADEIAVDFGTTGVWTYDLGVWTQISSANPESLMAADIDGDDRRDHGRHGVNRPVAVERRRWNLLSGVDVEGMAAGDVNADRTDELVGDFGTAGLWLLVGGAWTQLSAVNADYVTTANLDGTGGDEIIGDFGPIGLWVWNTGAWAQLSGANADYVTSGKTGGQAYLAADFGPVGLWIWAMPGRTGLSSSGVNADYMIAANTDGDTEDEIVGDFGDHGALALGRRRLDRSQRDLDHLQRRKRGLPGSGRCRMETGPMSSRRISGRLDLWLWNVGSWSQLSGVNPEYHYVRRSG